MDMFHETRLKGTIIVTVVLPTYFFFCSERIHFSNKNEEQED